MKTFILWMGIICFFVVPTAEGAVIFQDNFDSQADYNCGGGTPTGWSSTSGCASATYQSVLHYNWEIKSPGRGGTGKSFRVWKADSVWDTQIFSVLNYAFSAQYSDLYTRWYMKIPSTMSSNNLTYQKLWRLTMTDAEAGQIYINFNWGTFADLTFQVGTGQLSPAWYSIMSSSEIPRDDQWHCWELRVKLGTNDSNGILQFWLDGVQKYSNTSANCGGTSSAYYNQTGIGIGNCGDGSVWQSSWQSIEFDDYVLSTTYVGPGAVPNAPSPPKGLRIVN